MARFITTTEISFHLERIIRDSKFFIVIVSPYLKIPSRFQKLIAERLKRLSYLNIVFICRQADLKDTEKKWLESLGRARIYFCEELHAKCYLNEELAIVSSMNLYQHSMVNNVEFGTLFLKVDDAEKYQRIIEECKRLGSSSMLDFTAEQVEPASREARRIAVLTTPVVEEL